MPKSPALSDDLDSKAQEKSGQSFFSNPWIVILIWCLPFFAYLMTPGFYFEIFPVDVPWNTPPAQAEVLKNSDPSWIYAVSAQVLLTGFFLLIGFKSYLNNFSFRVHPATLLLGTIGCGLWIGICELQIERYLLGLFVDPNSWLPQRPGIDPWSVFSDSNQRLYFLFIRFIGLSLAIPIAEELFLRGFLLRVIEAGEWEKIPLRDLPWVSVLWAGIYGVAAHPAEAIAAFVWFSAVSVWVKKTGNFWDAVVIHMVTNFLLGIYVCTLSQWQYW